MKRPRSSSINIDHRPTSTTCTGIGTSTSTIPIRNSRNVRTIDVTTGDATAVHVINVPKLGASEFASLLNNNEPNAIIKALKRFVQVVRFERKLALHGLNNKVSKTGVEDEDDSNADDQNDDSSNSSDRKEIKIKNDEMEEMKDSKNDTNEAEIIDQVHRKKKQRHKNDESWKEDTESYNVPFVGTSFSTSNDSGLVVIGKWPTGFVQHYLTKSPLAIELTSDLIVPPVSTATESTGKNVHKMLLRTKQERKSNIICKLYLCSLIELITAAIPIEILQRRQNHYDNVDLTFHYPTCDARFIHEIVTKRLPDLLQFLQEEIRNHKNLRNSSSAMDGMDVSHYILRILYNLSQTSLQNARTVCRSFHTMTGSDDVLRYLLRPSSSSKIKILKSISANNNELRNNNIVDDASGVSNKNERSDVVKTCHRRIATLDFVTCMASVSLLDTSILSSICSSGSNKEPKISSGMLYISMKDGLQLSAIYTEQQTNKTGNNQNNYSSLANMKRLFRAMTKLLRMVRILLLTIETKNDTHNKSRLHSLKQSVWSLMLDIFNRDSIQNLCQLSRHAPTTTSIEGITTTIDYQSILSASDPDSSSTNVIETTGLPKDLVQVGIEARRLLYLVIANTDYSPLLKAIQKHRRQQQKHVTKNNNNIISNEYYEQIIVRALVALLEGSTSSSGSSNDSSFVLQIQSFVLYSLHATPYLLPVLFKVLTIPSEQQRPFAFLSRMNLLSNLVRNGPSVALCCVDSDHNDDDSVVQSTLLSTTVSSCIVPYHLRKPILTRLLVQCSTNNNHLVLYEIYKLLVFIIRRCQQYVQDRNKFTDYEFLQNLWTSVFQTILPELSVMIGTLSRLVADPKKESNTFITNTTKKTTTTKKRRIMMTTTMMIHGIVSRFLDAVTTLFPFVVANYDSSLSSSKLEWLKIIPTKAKWFCSSPIVIQRSILSAVQKIVSIQDNLEDFPISYFQTILNILLETDRRDLRQEVRTLAMTLLLKLFGSSSNRKDCTILEQDIVLEYEISCWFDGLTSPLLVNDFCALVQQCLKNPAMAIVSIAMAWEDVNLPPSSLPTFRTMSPILITSLEVIFGHQQGLLSNEFATLVYETSIRCLMYSSNPLPLAALIVKVGSPMNNTTTSPIQQSLLSFVHLVQYSKALIWYNSTSDRINCLSKSLETLLLSNKMKDEIGFVSQLLSEITANNASMSTKNHNKKQRKDSLGMDDCLLLTWIDHYKEERSLSSSISYATLTRYLLHVLAIVDEENDDDIHPQQQHSILFKCLCQLIPALLTTATKNEFLIWSMIVSACIRRIVSSNHHMAIVDFIIATSSSVLVSEQQSLITRAPSSLVQSSLATILKYCDHHHHSNHNNQQKQQPKTTEAMVSMYHLYLLGHSCSLDVVVDILHKLLRILVEEGITTITTTTTTAHHHQRDHSTEITILTLLYLKQFENKMENFNKQHAKAKATVKIMKVIRSVFELHDQIIVCQQNNTMKLLEQHLERIICQYMSSVEGSINQSTLPSSVIVEYAWNKLTMASPADSTSNPEKLIMNTIIQHQQPNNEEEGMSLRFLEILIRSDPIKFAPEIIKQIVLSSVKDATSSITSWTANRLVLVHRDCTLMITIMEAFSFNIPNELVDLVGCIFERFVHVVEEILPLILLSSSADDLGNQTTNINNKNETNVNLVVLEKIATALYLFSQQKEILEKVNLNQTRSVLHEWIRTRRTSATKKSPAAMTITNDGRSSTSSCSSLDQFNHQIQLCILQFAWNVIVAKTNTNDDNGQHTSRMILHLSSAILHRLALFVPRSLKLYFKREQTILTTSVFPITTNLHDHNPIIPISLLNKLLLLERGEDKNEGDSKYDAEYVLSSGLSFAIDSVIKACLRYGIGIRTTLDQCIGQLECLRLVRTIITSMNQDDNDQCTTFGSLLRQGWQVNNSMRTGVAAIALDVFEMCTTHSKFDMFMMTTIDNNNNDAKVACTVDNLHGIQYRIRLEFTSLLYDCLFVARDTFTFNENIWNVFLSSYNAGMTEVDQKLNSLLYLYITKAPDGSSATFLDQWKWGRSSNNHSSFLDNTSRNDDDWDWLPSSIDIHRIHATIAKFPIDATLSASAKISSHRVDNVPLVSENIIDKRYNPGFLLPIILGALQSDAVANRREQVSKLNNDVGSPTQIGHHHESRNHSYQHSSTRQEKFATKTSIHDNSIQFIHRLCDKGIMAMTLCSLCSNCHHIRRVAFSILGLLLAAINSKDAYYYQTNHNKWKDRPQLEMVLNSIVRAYAILYYKTNTGGDIRTDHDDHNDKDDNDSPENQKDRQTGVVVSKVSSFTAVFLAKTSLILMRPNDYMYIAANRFYLRSEIDCGAYQDMFVLPAFLFLFTSSVIDDEQRKRERKFAIELIRDGLVGGSDSYKLLVSSYVPDLLLTSLECSQYISSTTRGDGETILVFRTIRKMLVDGGDRAKQHIIGRLGILSWIRSFIQTPSFRYVVLTPNSFLAFLELVTTVISDSMMHSNIISLDEFEVSCTGISEAVMKQCLYYYFLSKKDKRIVNTTSSSSNSDDTVVSSSLSQAILRQTCDCIIAFHQQQKGTTTQSQKKQQQPECFHEQSLNNNNGLSLVTATKLLDELLLQVMNNKNNNNGEDEESCFIKMLHDTVYALCCMPFRSDENDDWNNNNVGRKLLLHLRYSVTLLKAAILCCSTRTTATGQKACSTKNKFMLVVLERLLDVVDNVPVEDNETATATTTIQSYLGVEHHAEGMMMKIVLLEHMFIWRRSCSISVDLRTAWIRCLYDLYYRYPHSTAVGLLSDEHNHSVDKHKDSGGSNSTVLDLCHLSLEIENSSIHQNRMKTK